MNYIFLIIPLILLLLIIFILRKLAIKKLSKRRRFTDKFKRGLQGEKEAKEFLKLKGYKMLDYQDQLKYKYWVGNRQEEAIIRPDFMVRKFFRTYIVEVKTGNVAPYIEKCRETRRQVFEYSQMVKCHGIYLLNIDDRIMQKIKFNTVIIKKWKKRMIITNLFYLSLISVLIFYFKRK